MSDVPQTAGVREEGLPMAAVRIAGSLSVFVGGLVLIGWVFDITVLKSVVPGWISVKANTALAFIISGIGVLFSSAAFSMSGAHRSKARSRYVRICASLVGIIGLLSLSEYGFGWDAGIDQWLFNEMPGAVGTSNLGRMAPDTAGCFVLIAIALWAVSGSRRARWSLMSAAISGAIITTTALASIVRYFTPVVGASGWFGLTAMAVPTALLFVILGVVLTLMVVHGRGGEWSLSRTATTAYVVGLALLVIVGLTSIRSFILVTETENKVRHIEQIMSSTTHFLSDVTRAQASTRGFLLTGDRWFEQLFDSAATSSRDNLAALCQLIGDDRQLQPYQASLTAQVDDALRWWRKAMDMRRTGDLTASSTRTSTARGQDLMDDIKALVDRMRTVERSIAEGHLQVLDDVSVTTHLIILAGMVGSLVIFLLVIMNLNRAVGDRLRIGDALQRSEQWFRTLFEQATDGICYLSSQGQFVAVNESFAKMHGYSVDEIQRMNMSDLVPPEGNLLLRERIRRVLAGEKLTCEVEHSHREGRKVPSEVASGSIRAGADTYLLEIHRDITERKRAEEALRESEKMLRNSQLIAGLGSYVLDIPAGLWKSSEVLDMLFGIDETFERSIQGWAALIHPDDRTMMVEYFGDLVLGQGKAFDREYRIIRHNDKAQRWVHGLGKLEFDVDGSPLNMRGTIQDITDRKHAEEAERHSRKELDRLFEVSPEMIGIFGFDGRFKRLNPAWEKALGYPIDTLLSRQFIEYVHPDDIDATNAESAKLAIGERTIQFENRYRCTDGSYRWLSWSVIPVIEEELLYGVARDVTERKQAEEKIRKLNDELEHRVVERTSELEAAYKALEAFTYSVSHDLRAPLRSIDGFSQALLEDYEAQIDERGKGYLMRVRNAAQRMGQLIDDILSLSHIHRAEISSVNVDLTALGEDIVQGLRQSHPRSNVEVQIEPEMVTFGDPPLLRVLLQNLLENAWKFTAKRDRAKIQFGSHLSDGKRVFFVRDNGAGFDMARADKLFTPFQRFHSQAEFVGTGIGLSSAQRIINRHKGRIWAESEINRGATFLFSI